LGLGVRKTGRSLSLPWGKTRLLIDLLGWLFVAGKKLEDCSTFSIPLPSGYSINYPLELLAVNPNPILNCSEIKIAEFMMVVLNFGSELMKLLVV
jgi:hypothetical protein